MTYVQHFFELAALQPIWIQFLMGIGAVGVSVAATACFIIVVGLITGGIDQEIRAIHYWIKERRRQRELTDDAMRQIRQRELHAGIRKLAQDDARKRLELVARTGERR